MPKVSEFKVYYDIIYASYQCIISSLSLDHLISSMFVFNLHLLNWPLRKFSLVLIS
mgnify:CR=1 FL=1